MFGWSPPRTAIGPSCASTGDSFPLTYPMEHALMARLAAVGAAVPHPIVGSWEVPDWTGPAFSLTSWAAGVPMRPSTERQAAPQLGRFLAALRTVRVPDGFGPLEIAPDGELRGSRPDLSKGVATWAGVHSGRSTARA
jgi:aminoglycoside phosphotransferase (APT) family kinase protein